MKLSDFVVQFIEAQGVKHVFMLPGGGAMHLNDSLGSAKELQYICTLHEQAAAIAADSYSQFTGNLGVAVVTTGPGGTNALTGLVASWLDSIPVMIFTGQVKTADLKAARQVRQMGFQEVDTVDMVKSVTKYAVTITDPKTIRFHLEKAAYLAKGGRPGPVWIDIPLDVQAAEIDPKTLKGFRAPARRGGSLKKPAAKAIGLISTASRPVILVGNGVRLAGATDEFMSLIEALKIPVMTTWKSIDFMSDDHSYYVGRPGAVGQRGANFAQQTSDLIMVLGARLDFGQTAYNHKNFAPRAKKIIVDIDSKEIKKLETKVHLPVVADAGVFVRELLKLAKRNKRANPAHKTWLARCKEWKEAYPVVLPEYWQQKNFVNDYVLVDILSDLLKEGDVFIPGSSGACSERSMQAFRVQKGVRAFNSEGLGSMGFGLPMAIGGCIANGCKRTVSIEGDGGFVMNIQELALVKRMQLPIKFFVLNNNGYASIRNTQNAYFGGRLVASSPESGLWLPDFKKIATAFGIHSVQITDHQNIRENVAKVLNHPGPVICEVLVSPEQTTQPRVTSKKLPDGKMVSLPMEDLWPFLDRAEFDRNMQVETDVRHAD